MASVHGRAVRRAEWPGRRDDVHRRCESERTRDHTKKQTQIKDTPLHDQSATPVLKRDCSNCRGPAMLQTRMFVIFSAFKTGPRCFGQDKLRTQRAGTCLSIASDSLLRLKRPRSNTHRHGAKSQRKKRTAGREVLGNTDSHPGWMGTCHYPPPSRPTRVDSIQQEASQL
jgi:hypothetical protein